MPRCSLILMFSAWLCYLSAVAADADVILSVEGNVGTWDVDVRTAEGDRQGWVGAGYGDGRHTSGAFSSFDNGLIQASAFALAPDSDTWAHAQASGVWDEQFTLDPAGVDAAVHALYAGKSLTLNLLVHGELSVAVLGHDPQLRHSASHVFELRGGGDLARSSAGLRGLGHLQIGDVLSIDVAPDPFGRVEFQVQFSARAVAASAETLSDFGSTARLTSITFEDGVRPEDLGYALLFRSGIDSPNLDPVPEPGSLALLMLGLGILAVRRTRRR